MITAEGKVNPSHAAKPAPQATAGHADRHSELAASRPRESLRQGDEVGERLLVHPAASLDVLVLEVADVGDGATEGGESEA